jgi:hypothetical protein
MTALRVIAAATFIETATVGAGLITTETVIVKAARTVISVVAVEAQSTTDETACNSFIIVGYKEH